jgi:hypothetical protein
MKQTSAARYTHLEQEKKAVLNALRPSLEVYMTSNQITFSFYGRT